MCGSAVSFRFKFISIDVHACVCKFLFNFIKLENPLRFLLKFTGKEEEINLLGDGTVKAEFGEWSWMSPEQVVELVCRPYNLSRILYWFRNGWNWYFGLVGLLKWYFFPFCAGSGF